MPRLQYQTIREQDFGGGLDQQSAENRIQPGFCEDLENADPNSAGQIGKRTGYQGYAGYVPVRVKTIEYTDDITNNITFIFDDSIEVPLGRAQPLVVLGQTSALNTANVGDFPILTETIQYYDSFLSDIRKTFFTGTNTLTIPQVDHTFTNPNLFIGVGKATDTISASHEQIFPDISLDTATYEISIDYTNSTGSDFQGFVWIQDKQYIAGRTYISTGNTGSNSYTITAGTHALDNQNIIVQVYSDAGGTYTRVNPDEVTIANGTGDVTVTLNDPASTHTIILDAASVANYKTGSVAPMASISIEIDTSGTTGSDFASIACYLEPTIGADLEQVMPDSIISDAANRTITVTFFNNNASGANFEVYWDYATISTNRIQVTGSTISTANEFTDTEPQLTVYGLCHEEIYGVKANREGWTNHIDSYRAPGETRLITGLGGNLFAARLRDEGTNNVDYLMPLFYPRLNKRLAADTILGPAFYSTGETPARTRGYITGDGGASNFFVIDSIVYNSGTGYMDYTLTMPNLAINGTLSTIIDTTAGLEDRFTAQDCGFRLHNGVFPVKAVTNPAADTLVISILNSSIATSDYDELDVGGRGGIFTDRITTSGDAPYLPNDTIASELFPDTVDFVTVENVIGTSVLISGVLDVIDLPGGLRMVASRTSSVIPGRTFANVADVSNIVRGDMLTYTDIDRQLRVKYVNTLSDVAVTISSDGYEATVTLGSGTTNSFFEGANILITDSVFFNGVHTITAISSSNTFRFDTSVVNGTSESATITGKTIQIDEELTFSDTIDSTKQLTVHSRWIPIEIPTDSFDATPKTRVKHFDSASYDNQAIIRSTMVNDNLYLTNDDDEVLKFDGTNVYRAGLWRWQPHMFAATDTTAAGVIEVGNPKVTTTAAAVENRFQIAPEDISTFRVGDQIKGTDTQAYTIIEITDDTPAAHITVDRTILTGASPQDLRRLSVFKYYFRMNAIDANNNIVASAATGSDDFNIKLGEDAAINLKVVGMPVWDIYDYDKLEVQIYRTKADSLAPFYLVATLPMDFDTDGGYLEYTDTTSDDFFTIAELDPAHSRLKGENLGTAWAQPLRAKYCTSSGNKLILGNLRDYPNLDIRLIKKNVILTQSVFTDAANRDWLFRKDNTDALTTTDMINRAKYEFRDVSTAATVTGITGAVGTSFTVTAANGLVAGDWVYLFHSATTDSNQLTYSGWWQVASATGANFTVSAKERLVGAAVNFPDKVLFAAVSLNIPVPIGTDGNYAMANGNRTASQPYEFLAMRRLADAINCTMRKTNQVTGFTPWMTANAGNEYNSGQLVIRQPKILDTSLEVQLPVMTGDFDVFANNIRRASGASAGAITRVYPSRIIASYSNFPEIFDNPTDVNDSFSDSAIDINSADGQEITAIIPFFGDAAFGSAQKSGIIVVFKTNSIYLVDLSAKVRKENPVQKLETMGKGCTAPYSVSVTRNGIMFANDTGIYRLSRDLRVEYVGRKYDRKFTNTVNRALLDLATGHHDTQANSYKLSYPGTAETENSTVAVYNHTREYEGQAAEGSWTTYTNHPATGWANLGASSYFASTSGRVFIIRRVGESSDYRDDDQAISMTVLARALDAGDAGRRKVHSQIISHYQVPSASYGSELEVAMNLSDVYQPTDSFDINTSSTNEDAFGLPGQNRIVSISSSIKDKVGVFIQLRYSNGTIDETLILTGFDLRVAAKDDKGILQAAVTKG